MSQDKMMMIKRQTAQGGVSPLTTVAHRVGQAARLVALGSLLVLLWYVLTEGAVSSWIVGVPTIVVALVLAQCVDRPRLRWRLDPMEVLRFAIYFVRESASGGIDVAGRVSAQRLCVAPGLVRYRWRLPADGPARALFALSVNLLPGTLVAAMSEHGVLIHVLDTEGAVTEELAELEQRVAGLFGLRLSVPEARDV
jgi:multicomponent Na+:H+ antiporter subunit E